MNSPDQPVVSGDLGPDANIGLLKLSPFDLGSLGYDANGHIYADERTTLIINRLFAALGEPPGGQALDVIRREIAVAQSRRRPSPNTYSPELPDPVPASLLRSPGRKGGFWLTADDQCPLDPRPEPVVAPSLPPPGAHCSPEKSLLPPNDAFALLWDTAAKPADRLAALGELRGTNQEADAITFLAEQIGLSDLPPDWRDAVVFAAEEVHFPPHLHAPLADRLLSLAATLRAAPGANDKVVWSALRRGASLLKSERAERLIDFLVPAAGIDTRAVALQAIARVFELAPPAQVPTAIADRVWRFADRFLDPDVFTPGELSAIGRHAVVALAGVGDPRLSAALQAVSNLNRPWFTRRVQGELVRLAREWQSRGFSPEQPAVGNLTDALARGQ